MNRVSCILIALSESSLPTCTRRSHLSCLGAFVLPSRLSNTFLFRKDDPERGIRARSRFHETPRSLLYFSIRTAGPRHPKKRRGREQRRVSCAAGRFADERLQSLDRHLSLFPNSLHSPSPSTMLVSSLLTVALPLFAGLVSAAPSWNPYSKPPAIRPGFPGTKSAVASATTTTVAKASATPYCNWTPPPRPDHGCATSEFFNSTSKSPCSRARRCDARP